jgi:hypothetical protein
MADVAQLGIQVTERGTDKATDGLTKLAGAAARAEASTDGLAAANRGATGAAASAAAAYAKEGTAAQTASRQIEMMNRAANSNVAGHRGNIANLAAQVQDTIISAQGGMAALTIGFQQGTQAAMVLASMDKPIQGFAQAFAMVLSPVSLVTIAVITLGAALIQMVNWGKLAGAALRGLAEILDEIAPYAVAAAAALALLYAPAIIGGVITLIAWLGRLVAQLGAVAVAFLAANPVVAFVAGITVAVAAANIFRKELEQIFGFDIVKAAKDGVNTVIGAFVGGYEALKAVWSQLPGALADIVYSTANKVIDGIESMVQSAIDGLNNLINKYALFSASIGKPLSPETFNNMTLGPVEFGRLSNPRSGEAASALQSAQDAYNGAQGKDYAGKAYEYVAERASKAAGKVRELADWMGKVDEKGKKKGGKTEAEKYDDIINGAERRIASLQAERDALGLTEEAALKLRYEQDMLNQAQARGITLTASQRAEISGLAERMASLEYGTERIREQMDFAKDTTRGFLDDFRAGLENGESVWKSFGDAALGVLDRITDKLLNDVLDAVFKVTDAGSGGGGGLLGNLFGSLFGGGSSAFPSKPGVGLYAAGTPAARPGLAWVGEKGPELVHFKGGEEVIPNHRILPAANQNNASTRSQPSDQPRELVLRVIGEEGPMFRPTIRAESQDIAVTVVQESNKARENLYQNGESH